MRQLLMLLALAGLTGGCAQIGRSPVSYSPPSSEQVRVNIGAATASVHAGKLNIQTAKTSIGKAREAVTAIEMKATVDLRPHVEELKLRLNQADVQLRQAGDRATDAIASLDKSEEERQLLATLMADQTKTLNQVAADKNKALDLRDKAQREADHQKGLAWKWRKYCFSMIGGAGLLLLFMFRRPIGALFGVPIP